MWQGASTIADGLRVQTPGALTFPITSANAEDHVSMGANEARHVLAMANDLGKVLAHALLRVEVEDHMPAE